MSVETLTFGCRLNAYESEVVKAEAQKAGLSDVLVVNTCAVTAEAVRQARQAIRKARRDNPDRPIVVTGCAAQTEARSFGDMEEVDLVIGNDAHLLQPDADVRQMLGDRASVPVFGAAGQNFVADD